VRENTILSFLKAATNHTDFIEFDVHVCKASLIDDANSGEHRHMLLVALAMYMVVCHNAGWRGGGAP
jgi:Glycerophosphoryl diester phosphodiesterase family